MTPLDQSNDLVSPDELLTNILEQDHFHEKGPVKRWFIQDELINQLREYSGEIWLPIFKKRLSILQHNDHLNTLFHLAGYLLKGNGADLIRGYWDLWSQETFKGLTFAAVHCLPSAEGFGMVTGKLDRMNPQDRLICKFVLGWFESPLALKWIEEHITTPIDVTWGTLAARSQFDWEHFQRWLYLGRPLSLVALDALGFCITTPKAPDGHQYKPLINPPPHAVFMSVLEDYRKNDPVVRVRRATESLMSELRTKGL